MKVRRSPLLFIGVLLLASGCPTDPGSLGPVAGTDSEGGEGSAASSDSMATTGATEDPTEGATEGSSTDAGEESGSTGETIDPPVCTVDVSSGLQRRMTAMQFEHAISDLFDVEVEVMFGDGGSPFDAGEEIDAGVSMQIEAAAEIAAAQFVPPVCGGDLQTCGQSFVDSWAPLVLRGQEDTDALMDVYGQEASYEAGVAAVVAAMITDPAFAMLTPTGTMEGEFLALDGRSIATRLALLGWNSVPDAELLAAADSLTEPSAIEAQLDRMFADSRYARAQADFYFMVTGIRYLPSVDRRLVDEAWSEEIGAAMVEEQRRFVGALASDPNATLDHLFSADFTYVNPELAALYGDDLVTPAPQAGWGPAELDPEHRGGLFTQLGFIASTSDNVPPSEFQEPSGRGNRVLRMMCFAIPTPPADTSDAPSLAVTNRAEWEEFIAEPVCATCHTPMDAPGFAFGNYDGLGRWNETGDSTETTETITGITVDGAVELGAALAGTEEMQRCFAERHLEFAVRHPLTEADACTIDSLQQTFVESGGNLRALVQATATSEAFGLARPEN